MLRYASRAHVRGILTVPGCYRFLIVECPLEVELCGGVGSNVFGMAHAFLLAVVTRRAFLINVEKPLPFSTVVR